MLQFTSEFLKSFQKVLGSKVNLGTLFHPHKYGKVEHTIQILDYMLRASVIDFRGNFEDHRHLIKFSYYNSNNSRIQIAPYKALM